MFNMQAEQVPNLEIVQKHNLTQNGLLVKTAMTKVDRNNKTCYEIWEIVKMT